jgi:ubiquitin C-terminal hydrolase
MESVTLWALDKPLPDMCEVLGYDVSSFYEASRCRGFSNLGHTCWANALLSALFVAPPVRSWVRQHYEKCEILNKELCPLCCIAIDFAKISKTSSIPVNAPSVVTSMHIWSKVPGKRPKFRIGTQACVGEAFTVLVDACNESDNQNFKQIGCEACSSTTQYSSPAWSIFGGLEKSTVACSACAHHVVTHAWFNTLTLNLPEQGGSLKALLAADMRTEPIEDSKCESNLCHGREVVRLKWKEVLRWPDVLVVRLVRWLPDGSKSDATVTFDLEAPMGGKKYKLIAVCEHQGDSADGGHYVAYTLSNNGWLLCDDSSVQLVEPRVVLEAEPYLLIYHNTH